LNPDEIQEPAADVCASVDELDIGVSEINDVGDIEISFCILLFNRIQSQFPPSSAVIKLQMIIGDEPIRYQSFCAKPYQLG
jgi:hypothetical protein